VLPEKKKRRDFYFFLQLMWFCFFGCSYCAFGFKIFVRVTVLLLTAAFHITVSFVLLVPCGLDSALPDTWITNST
jgi:hypothetical protein